VQRNEFDELMSNPRLFDLAEAVSRTITTVKEQLNISQIFSASNTNGAATLPETENLEDTSSSTESNSNTPVLPKAFIQLLQNEASKHIANKTEPFTKSNHNFHQGILTVVLSWWSHRTDVNKKITVFNKNLSKKKKFLEVS